MASPEDDKVSAELAGFIDPEAEARERWARIERQALILCDPLSRLIGHKRICDDIDISKGQLSRELSPHYENHLGLLTTLCIGRVSQNERLAQLIVCDGLGMRMPEWQRKKATIEEELRALKEECRENGAAGAAILDGARRRVRHGR